MQSILPGGTGTVVNTGSSYFAIAICMDTETKYTQNSIHAWMSFDSKNVRLRLNEVLVLNTKLPDFLSSTTVPV